MHEQMREFTPGADHFTKKEKKKKDTYIAGFLNFVPQPFLTCLRVSQWVCYHCKCLSPRPNPLKQSPWGNLTLDLPLLTSSSGRFLGEQSLQSSVPQPL